MYGKSSRFVVGFQLLAVLLGTVCLLIDTAAAQTNNDPPKSDATANAAAGEKEEYTEVYAIQHADARLLLQVASSVIPDAHAVVDSTQKRMIVTASRSAHDRLAKLIQEIDVPAEPGERSQLRVFYLAHSEARSMLEVISNILDTKDVRIAVDPRTNSLLTEGTEDSLETIEALLSQLDKVSENDRPRSEKTLRVRIVWFADEAPSDEAVKLDDDLRSVQSVLSEIGVEPIRQVGQIMVGVTPGGDFQVGCSAVFGDGPANLEIKGKLDVERETPHLMIEISADRKQSARDADDGCESRVSLVNLETQIVAPLGHCVVLGVTPVQKQRLAFAVQVRPGD